MIPPSTIFHALGIFYFAAAYGYGLMRQPWQGIVAFILSMTAFTLAQGSA